MEIFDKFGEDLKKNFNYFQKNFSNFWYKKFHIDKVIGDFKEIEDFEDVEMILTLKILLNRNLKGFGWLWRWFWPKIVLLRVDPQTVDVQCIALTWLWWCGEIWFSAGTWYRGFFRQLLFMYAIYFVTEIKKNCVKNLNFSPYIGEPYVVLSKSQTEILWTLKCKKRKNNFQDLEICSYKGCNKSHCHTARKPALCV